MKTKSWFAVITAALFTTTTIAQSKTSFGIRAGINFQNLNGKNSSGDKLDNKLKTGFNVGVNAEVPVGIDFYVQPGLLLSTKGAKFDEVNGEVTRNLSYIEIPVNFLYKPELGEGRMLLGFGPYAAFAVGGNTQLGNNKNDIEF